MDKELTTVLISAVTGGVISYLTSYFISKVNIHKEYDIWNRNFAITYVNTVREDSEKIKLLTKQFSIGFIIIYQQDEDSVLDKYFIPYNCRISVGRGEHNDIILNDPTVSRDHGVFFYKNRKIYFQDFASLNKSIINGKEISKSTQLRDGDDIKIGNAKLKIRLFK